MPLRPDVFLETALLALWRAGELFKTLEELLSQLPEQ
jgi:hypothetical protein